jgi:hypothetical protein
VLTSTDARNVMPTNVYDDLGRKTQDWQRAAGTGSED